MLAAHALGDDGNDVQYLVVKRDRQVWASAADVEFLTSTATGGGCRPLQVTQTEVVGMASSRASPIGPPHSTHSS